MGDRSSKKQITTRCIFLSSDKGCEENETVRRDGVWAYGGVWEKMLRKGLSHKMAFEQRTELSERRNQPNILQERVPARGKEGQVQLLLIGVPMACPGTMRRSLWLGHPEWWERRAPGRWGQEGGSASSWWALKDLISHMRGRHWEVLSRLLTWSDLCWDEWERSQNCSKETENLLFRVLLHKHS